MKTRPTSEKWWSNTFCERMNATPELWYFALPPFGVAPLPILEHIVPSGRTDHPGDNWDPSGVLSDIDPRQRRAHPFLETVALVERLVQFRRQSADLLGEWLAVVFYCFAPYVTAGGE